MFFRPFILALLLLAQTSIAAEPYTSDDFVTSYWFGPPGEFTTLERYREIKDANFTVAFPMWVGLSLEKNKAMLDYCQKLGMKAIIYDSRMSSQLSDDAKRAIDGMVKDYADHPALLGYSITDEPPAGRFDDLAAINAYLKSKDPKHPGYVNLMPTWARDIPGPAGSKFSYLGTATYEDYVRTFVQKFKPAWLCYDNYGMLKQGDRGDFHENLATVRKVSMEAGIPFWNIVLVTQHGDFRVLTEAELRFQAMQTIAFGARGLVWFTYWSPQGFDTGTTWTHAMINQGGVRDPEHYDMVKRINAEVLALGRELKRAKSVAITQHDGPKGADIAVGKSPIAIDAGKVTVGVFDDPSGKHFALLASLDYKAATTVKGRIEQTKAVERFDVSARKWVPSDKTFQIDLPPGSAALLRW